MSAGMTNGGLGSTCVWGGAQHLGGDSVPQEGAA